VRECRAAAAASKKAAIFGGSVRKWNRPKGCFAYKYNWYFNTHKTGRSMKDRYPVCKITITGERLWPQYILKLGKYGTLPHPHMVIIGGGTQEQMLKKEQNEKQQNQRERDALVKDRALTRLGVGRTRM